MTRTSAAQGGLLSGAKVDGELILDGVQNPNFFDSSSGQVPDAGFGNSAPHPPTNITVNDTITEFASKIFPGPDSPVLLTVDLSTTGVITLKEKYRPLGPSQTVSVASRQYTLISNAFSGLSATVVKNTCNKTGIQVNDPVLQGDTLVTLPDVVIVPQSGIECEFSIRLKVGCGPTKAYSTGSWQVA